MATPPISLQLGHSYNHLHPNNPVTQLRSHCADIPKEELSNLSVQCSAGSKSQLFGCSKGLSWFSNPLHFSMPGTVPLSECVYRKLVATEVYTHLNCSIKPRETSSNSGKLSPDTLTARSRYTNQMDQGLESILPPSGSNHVTGSTCWPCTEPSPLFYPQTPQSRAEPTYFLSCICL